LLLPDVVEGVLGRVVFCLQGVADQVELAAIDGDLLVEHPELLKRVHELRHFRFPTQLDQRLEQVPLGDQVLSEGLPILLAELGVGHLGDLLGNDRLAAGLGEWTSWRGEQVATTPGEDISRPSMSGSIRRRTGGPLVLPVVIARGELGRGETVLWTGPSAWSSDQPLRRTKPCQNHRPEMTTAVTIRVVKKLALRMPASKAPLASTIPGPARALQVTAISGGLLLHRGVSQMIQYGQTLKRGGRSSGRLSRTATTTPSSESRRWRPLLIPHRSHDPYPSSR